MKPNWRFNILLLSLLLTGCAVTREQTYQATGQNRLCDKPEVSLGNIAVLPESAWRVDQKEPLKRESMALQVIMESFSELPCGSIQQPGSVEAFSNWSNQAESTLTKQFSARGVDTIIMLRIEELTPHFEFTFSIPFLWIGSNEADFRIRALSTVSGEVITDMRVRRTTGGPFNIRPAEWSRAELSSALANIIQTP
ncbi:MAG: hypothetical protein ABW139_01120 [Candidatus Thiodiazotropha sp. DIVDIV]